MEIKPIKLKSKNIIKLLSMNVAELINVKNNIAINPISNDRFRDIFGVWFDPTNIKKEEKGYIGTLVSKKVYISLDVPQNKLALIKKNNIL